MDLNTLWFILIAVLYIGFFILEGFDFGVGMLLPILGKGKTWEEKDLKRRAIINTIGPFWDGNEVWLLTAGGATFAAFPQWYATLFSGFYLPLFLLLLALIFRGVAFEFRSKHPSTTWRKFWDWSIFGGSIVPSLLLGVAFANLARGLPINADMEYTGGMIYLLNPYGILGGIATVVIFAFHGALFLSMKTTDDLSKNATRIARTLWLPAVLIDILLLIATYIETDILARLGINPGIIPLGGVIALLLSGYFAYKGRAGWAFSMTVITIAAAITTLFLMLYPDVMISVIDPAFNLTIYNAASSPYTLKVMSIVAIIFVPVVLLYQGWTYWVFRQRVLTRPESLTY